MADPHRPRASPSRRRPPGLSRRRFLGAAAGGAAAVGIGGLAAVGAIDLGVIAGRGRRRDGGVLSRTYPFGGPHQAGIVTPAQDRMYTAAFDLTTIAPRRARRPAPALDDRVRAAHGRPRPRVRSARPAAPTTRRPTTPARRSACRPPGSRSRSASAGRCSSGPTPRAATGSGSRRGSRRRSCELPHFPGDDLDPARTGGDLMRPGLRRRPAGRRARGPQPHPGRLRLGAASGGRSSASVARRRRRPRRSRRATCSGSRTAPPTSRPRKPRTSTASSGSSHRTSQARRRGWPAARTPWSAGSGW